MKRLMFLNILWIFFIFDCINHVQGSNSFQDDKKSILSNKHKPPSLHTNATSLDIMEDDDTLLSEVELNQQIKKIKDMTYELAIDVTQSGMTQDMKTSETDAPELATSKEKLIEIHGKRMDLENQIKNTDNDIVTLQSLITDLEEEILEPDPILNNTQQETQVLTANTMPQSYSEDYYFIQEILDPASTNSPLKYQASNQNYDTYDDSEEPYVDMDYQNTNYSPKTNQASAVDQTVLEDCLKPLIFYNDDSQSEDS